MSEKDNRQELRGKLIRAKDIEEVRAILGPETAEEEIIQTWREIEAHRPEGNLEEVDEDELDAVSGGADRDLDDDGCSASVEKGSWCGSDDYCTWFDVTYSNHSFCTDGKKHDWELLYSGTGLIGYKCYYKYECKKCQKLKTVLVE
ncbi:MAG: hypothetical protein Q4G00_05940 [Clostridia bacterium]|nr:hypothetical protein [Clostridia bacterium]